MILTYEEIRKAAEFAAEQMWPESGYVGWTEDDAVYHRKFIEACLEKLRGGVELPEAFAHAAYEEHPSYEGVGDIVYYHPNAKPANCIDLFTRNQLLQYGAAQRLAASERGTTCNCSAGCVGNRGGPHPHPHPYPFYEATPRKRRPQVQRLVTSSSAEIKAWNAAVDARKAAKKDQQP